MTGGAAKAGAEGEGIGFSLSHACALLSYLRYTAGGEERAKGTPQRMNCVLVCLRWSLLPCSCLLVATLFARKTLTAEVACVRESPRTKTRAVFLLLLCRRKLWEEEEPKWEHDLFHMLQDDEPPV